MKNLFGKTLVVLIFMFSLILFAMSGAVYMTHTNLRVKAEDCAKKVQAVTQKLEGNGTNPGFRKNYIQLGKSIEAEEILRDMVVNALTEEVNARKSEYDVYLKDVKEQEKNIREQSVTMLRYTFAMLKFRIMADDTLVKVQNERNARVRTVQEYVKNMNQIEDLTQQLQTLEKRERSLTINQTLKPNAQ